jgi:aquaporin Z
MNRYIAEFVGTFVLVFAGVGSAVFAGHAIGTLGISMAFGLALLTMVYAIGPISGCHINPAVTLGLALARKFEVKYVPGYIVAQVVGAVAAGGLVFVIAMGAPGGYSAAASGLASNGFGAHSPGGYGWGSAFVIEMVLTSFLVLTVLGSTDVKAPAGFAGLAIGLMLLLTNLVAIPVSNASINPVRSIGPAVWAGGWALGQLWLFIAAPLLGGCLAAGVYEAMKPSTWGISPVRAVQATARQQAERLTEEPPGLAEARGGEAEATTTRAAERTTRNTDRESGR